jgi:hypothetical protein
MRSIAQIFPSSSKDAENIIGVWRWNFEQSLPPKPAAADVERENAVDVLLERYKHALPEREKVSNG